MYACLWFPLPAFLIQTREKGLNAVGFLIHLNVGCMRNLLCFLGLITLAQGGPAQDPFLTSGNIIIDHLQTADNFSNFSEPDLTGQRQIRTCMPGDWAKPPESNKEHVTGTGRESDLTLMAVPAVYTWSGGHGDWTIAANWTPARTLPDATDILQFNDGGAWTVTGVPAETIGKLLVSGNTTIHLQAGTASTLTIAGDTGTDLDITSGSALILDGSGAMSVILSTGATGAVAGNMTLSTADHKLDAADAGAICFISPAVFTQDTGCDGHVFNASGTPGAIVFGAGTSFVQKAGDDPFGLTAPASKVVFQSGSLYSFRVAATAPSLANRVYGDFEVANGELTIVSSGSVVWTVEKLIISNGALEITGDFPVTLKGDLQIDAGQSFIYSPSNPRSMSFSGSTAQALVNNGTFTLSLLTLVVVNNPSAQVVLNTDVSLGNLMINTGSVLNLNGNLLSVKGSMTNNGAMITGVGTVDFTGTTGTQTLSTGGTGTGKTFYNLSHSGAGILNVTNNHLRVLNSFNNSAGTVAVLNVNLTVGGSFSSIGTYTPSNSLLTFNGSANQGWTGAAGNNYGAVSIAKTTGDVVLGSPVTVTNLTLSGGKLELGAHNLVITGSSSGGSSTDYIKTNGTGTVTIQAISAAAKNFPVGNSTYNPLVIANGSSHHWTVKVKDELTGVLGPYNTDRAVLRTWVITPSTNPPAAGPDLIFQWDGTDPSQVGPLYDNNANIQLWHYDFAWISASVSTAQSGAPNARTLTRSGWTRFSDFAISNFSSPLPVGMVSFSGYKDGRRNLLQWTTSSEINNLGFEIQRSADGVQYNSIDFVNSKAPGGNSTVALYYTYTDHTPAGEKQYYRLRQVDIGGQSRYSSVLMINSGKPSRLTLQGLYPNPSRGTTQLFLASPGAGAVTLLVTDMAGRNIMRKVYSVEAGNNTLPLDVSGLQGGTYIVRVLGDDGTESRVKLVKE